MTRINVISPHLLSDAHLGAEYRELPRVFGQVRAAIARGEKPDDPRNPKQYVLGTGHVRFFYNKLGFLALRYWDLVEECRYRGRKVTHPTVSEKVWEIPNEWWNDWVPPEAAKALNISRINERGGLKK